MGTLADSRPSQLLSVMFVSVALNLNRVATIRSQSGMKVMGLRNDKQALRAVQVIVGDTCRLTRGASQVSLDRD